MPTRKQRRRQQKSRRHEWEYVYVDDEGQEVPVDPAELRQSKEEREKSRNGRRPASGKPAERRGRTIAPPSWSRVGRRAVFIAPVVIIAMMLLNRHQPLSGRIVPALVLLAFFLPFSYFTDAAAYRMYKKRLERTSSRRKDS